MSLVSDVIANIRVEIDDTDSSRFEDDTTLILPLVKKALRRAENILVRRGMDFAKTSTTLTVSSGASTTALPDLFKLDAGLYKNYEEIRKVSDDEFERTYSGDFWRINGSNVELLSSVTSDTAYTFYYYPYIDFSAYVVGTTMPWNGRLDDIIVDYVAMRLKNIDEYDTSMEKEMLAEMQTNILETYAPLTPVIQDMNGPSEI